MQRVTNAYQEIRQDAISTQAVKLYLDDKLSNSPEHYRAFIVCVVVKNSHEQLLRVVLGDVQYETTLRTGDDVTEIAEV